MLTRFVGTCVLVACSSHLAVAGSLRDDVRDKMQVVYVHGVNAELARQVVGDEGVPYLIELLHETDFAHRDNVVAFLAYLAHDADAMELIRYLEDAPVDPGTAEEHRATLMVPEALGRMALRGGTTARALLDGVSADSRYRERADLSQMIDYGLGLAEEAAQIAVPDPIDDEPINLAGTDSNPTAHRHSLTYANHAATNIKITDPTVDAAMTQATLIFGTENATNDTSCCIEFKRSGPGKVFGVAGDGLDVITTSSELNQVINNPIARVKVVDLINWCGGSGSNIIGCGNTPGKGIALVRQTSSTFLEGQLWAHEYGHNCGLGHNGSFGFVMYGSISFSNTRLTSFECSKYHVPSGSAQAIKTDIGICHDDDDDGLVTVIDNCPDDANTNQADNDGDRLGNVCDNCPDQSNVGQTDCDFDGSGDVCDASSLPPDAVGGVGFINAQRLGWNHTPLPTEKNIYRGNVDVSDDWPANESIVATVPTEATSWVETETPDGLYYYLVKGLNECGEGP